MSRSELSEDSNKTRVRLDNIFRTLCDNQESLEVRRQDLFVAAVIAVMLDKEFIPYIENSTRDSDETCKLSKLKENWRRPDGSYEMKYSLVQFPDHFVKLVVTPLGDIMVVNVILIDMNNDVYSKCLPLSQYIVAPDAALFLDIYGNLSQFAHILKSTVVGPARNQIIRYHGYESASLIGLPREVLLQIFMYLSVKDIVNVLRTCRDMQWIKSDHVLWRALLLRDYSKVIIPVPDDLDYMKAYIETERKTQDELLREQRTSQNRLGYLHHYMDYSDFVSNIEQYYNFD